MAKLFNAYFCRLSRWTVFRILLALLFAGGIAAAIIMRSVESAWNLPYILAYLVFPHYVGILTGLFNYPLFTNGTIRNQLSAGHKRSHIFLADWAVSNAFAVALYLVFAASFFVTFALCSGSGSASAAQNTNLMEGMPENILSVSAGDISAKAIASSVLISAVQIIFFTTVTQLFCIIFKGVKSFLAIYLGNQAIMFAGIVYATLAGEYNLPEKLTILFPTDVCMSMSSSFAVDSDFLPALCAMLAETAALFLAGILYFRKTDFN